MNRLPCERGDPLGVATKSISNCLSRLGIPKPHLHSIHQLSSHLNAAKQRTVLSMLPVATVRSIPSHSTHSNHPVWPASVYLGVSVSRSHRRQVLSPDPVASIFPVGENEAQRIGEE